MSLRLLRQPTRATLCLKCGDPDKTVASKLVGRNAMALVASPVHHDAGVHGGQRFSRGGSAPTTSGAVYFATTVLTLAFLLVEWGGTTQVAADVARIVPVHRACSAASCALAFSLPRSHCSPFPISAAGCTTTPPCNWR